MKRIVVYELVSGGGLAGEDAALRAELMPQGRAMRDALLADLLAVDGLAVSVADCAEAPVPPGAARVLRAAPGQAPLQFIAQLARAHDLAWIVAPESGGLLSQCQAVVGDARWLGCSAQAIAVASSKARTLRALQAAGVHTPLDAALAAESRRWVVKPDDGAGAVATRTFVDRAAAQASARQRQEQGEAVVLEAWVEGAPMSLSLLVDDGPGGSVDLLSINRQAIHIDINSDGDGDGDGAVHFEGVQLGAVQPDDPRLPALMHLARATVSALPGLRGFVGIDLVWHARHGPVAIEVNPRVSAAYIGQSARLGRNLAADVLALHARRTAPLAPHEALADATR